jgi:hypothetical protein
MNPNHKRWIIRIAVVLIVGLAGLYWSVREQGRTLTIENRSEQSIAELKITISGQSTTFQDVKAGAQVFAPCPASGDGLFSVEGKLADGTRVRANGRIADSLYLFLLPGGQLQQRGRRQSGERSGNYAVRAYHTAGLNQK